MDAINPSVNTTKGELQERIDYMVNEASRLEEVAKTDEYGAMKQCAKKFCKQRVPYINFAKK